MFPDDRSVVLGIVSTKVPDLEAAEDLKRRIDEAARHIDRERLSLSPQCGFASTVAGNRVAEEDEKAKLETIVQVAKEVWA